MRITSCGNKWQELLRPFAQESGHLYSLDFVFGDGAGWTYVEFEVEMRAMSITPQDLQKLLDEREASRASRKRAWENLQEIRWVLKDVTGMDLPPPARKTIDLEGRVVKDGVRTVLRDRQEALSELIEAIRKYRKLSEKTPLTLQGSDFAQAVEELNKAIDRAEGLLVQ